MSDSDSKLCSRCRQIKPLSDFCKNRSRKDGLHHACRDCHKAQYERWKSENPEKLRKYQQQYDEANRERKQTYRKKRYADNREAALEHNKLWREQNKQHLAEYRETHREKRIQYNRDYYEKNRVEINRQGRILAADRRALIAAAEGSHTVAEITQMIRDQDGLCCYCEIVLNGSYHVEHLTPLSRGGRNDWTNIGISCVPCNLQKHARTAEEFMNWKLFRTYV